MYLISIATDINEILHAASFLYVSIRSACFLGYITDYRKSNTRVLLLSGYRAITLGKFPNREVLVCLHILSIESKG